MARRLNFLVTAAVLVAACDGTTPQASAREAEVYAAAIETIAPDAPVSPGTAVAELERVAYVGPLDEEVELSLEVQAAVVEALDEFATVRFVDEKDEAIDEDHETMPVLEDGVLLLVGSVPLGRSPEVDVVRYVDRRDTARFRVVVERAGERWRVVDAVERAAR